MATTHQSEVDVEQIQEDLCVLETVIVRIDEVKNIFKMKTADQQAEAWRKLMLQAFYLEEQHSDDLMVDSLLESSYRLQVLAAQRCAKSRAGGKKGGRPKFDRSEVKRLHDLGHTPQEIAGLMGASVRTVKKAITELDFPQSGTCKVEEEHAYTRGPSDVIEGVPASDPTLEDDKYTVTVKFSKFVESQIKYERE
jgi:hypothetical protein